MRHFSIPPLSVVGLSEEQAIEQTDGDILVFTSGFNPMKNSISGYVIRGSYPHVYLRQVKILQLHGAFIFVVITITNSSSLILFMQTAGENTHEAYCQR